MTGLQDRSALQTQHSTLQHQHSNTQNSALRTQHSALTITQHSALSTQNSELRTQHSELSTQNSELGTQHYFSIRSIWTEVVIELFEWWLSLPDLISAATSIVISLLFDIALALSTS